MRRTPLLTVAVVAAVTSGLLSACSSGSGSGVPDWRPSPTGQAIEGPGAATVEPILPIPTGGNAVGGQGGGSAAPGPSSSAPAVADPRVVATRLTAPVGLALLPDNTALVGERTTGRIVRVQPRAGQPVPTVRTLHGLDFHGDGGLLDLAVSPSYDEDNLIYAYVTTPTDNRVVEFTLRGPVTPVFTGIPKGRRDNTGRILIAPDGSLFIGTGDAGHARLAADPTSLAGKILHITDIGRPAPGNPVKGSAVYASGERVVDGLCNVAGTPVVFATEDGARGHPDVINQIGRGDYAGWPTTSRPHRAPVKALPQAYSSPGGCAAAYGRLWIGSLDGQALVSAPVGGTPTAAKLGDFTAALHGKYGRLRTVVAAPDGALWLTTSNKDGHGQPVPTDERVIRYIPGSQQTGGSRV